MEFESWTQQKISTTTKKQIKSWKTLTKVVSAVEKKC